MILPDANLLLYAYDQSSPFHARAKAWCERIMSGPAPVILLPAVIFGFVRISTHPRVFHETLAVSEAAIHVRSWLARRHVQLHEMLADDVEAALKRKVALMSDSQRPANALRD